jgi:hypothetical protein
VECDPDDEEYEDRGSARIVGAIGLVAREFHTPIPMVLKLPFRLFLALIADYNRRVKMEQQAHEEAMAKSRRE